MEDRSVLTKVLAVSGTVLVWLTILTPIGLTLGLLISRGLFRFDYLMPAELFPLALVGAALLLWAAIRARSRLKLISWSLGVAVVSLLGTQGLAVVTGLAHGDTEPGGWEWGLVLAVLAMFEAALVALAIGAILLLIDLYRSRATRSAA